MQKRHVTFHSAGILVAGDLYLPDDTSGKLPGIVLANAITATKGINLPYYAEALANAGFAALAFDYRTWGESGGEPRFQIVPYDQQQDIRNAVTWLGAQPEVDAEKIGAWGISIGAAHLLHLGAYDRRLKAIVCVATGLNAFPAMMGVQGVQAMLSGMNRDRDARFATGEAAHYMPAVGMPGEMALMAGEEAYIYYMNAQKAGAPYDNQVTVESVEKMIEYNADGGVSMISPTPLLMIHADADLIPMPMVEEVFARAGNPKKLLALVGLHTDLYSGGKHAAQVAAESAAWFRAALLGEGALPEAAPAAARSAAMTAEQKIARAERNRAIINEFYKQSHLGNLAVYDELFTADFLSHGTGGLGDVVGGEAFKQAYIYYVSVFPDFYTDPILDVAEGDYVFAYGLASGTHQGAFMGVPPTGKKIQWTGMVVYRLNDEGKIVERWQDFDALSMMAQMGAGGPPAAPRG